ncbi:MAG TPA: hypothetical protein VIV11_43230 [Kofleriaceae bacterium]
MRGRSSGSGPIDLAARLSGAPIAVAIKPPLPEPVPVPPDQIPVAPESGLVIRKRTPSAGPISPIPLPPAKTLVKVEPRSSAPTGRTPPGAMPSIALRSLSDDLGDLDLSARLGPPPLAMPAIADDAMTDLALAPSFGSVGAAPAGAGTTASGLGTSSRAPVTAATAAPSAACGAIARAPASASSAAATASSAAATARGSIARPPATASSATATASSAAATAPGSIGRPPATASSTAATAPGGAIARAPVGAAAAMAVAGATTSGVGPSTRAPAAPTPSPYAGPPALYRKIRYAVISAKLTSAGIEAHREDGSHKLVEWEAIVGIIARRLPSEVPFDGTTFVDLVSLAGSTLRIMPWTEITGAPVYGEGEDRARTFVQLIAAHCLDAKLDSWTKVFADGAGHAAQLPNIKTLAAHDERMA